MTIDKLQPSVNQVSLEAKAAQAADAAARAQSTARKQQTEAQQAKVVQKGMAEVVSVPVKVSVAAQERLQAARVASEKDAFDQEKVDRIRREIAEGSFPIDEERLARKFLELEKQLGDLGR